MHIATFTMYVCLLIKPTILSLNEVYYICFQVLQNHVINLHFCNIF